MHLARGQMFVNALGLEWGKLSFYLSIKKKFSLLSLSAPPPPVFLKVSSFITTSNARERKLEKKERKKERRAF